MEMANVNIRIRMLNGSDLQLAISPSSTSVHELKQRISEKSNVPVESQRLIFQGRLLKDSDYLSTYSISHGMVIHMVPMVAHPESSESPAEEHDETLANLVRGVTSNVCIAIKALLNRSTLNTTESLEILRQNLYMTNSLLSVKTPLTIADKSKPFQTSTLRFHVGQWVDVKDTIDQWLEAQITKIHGTKAYIHYNGWGNRWDEWIDLSSPRIALFRTHTVQLPTSKYISPAPNIKPDPENHEIPSYSTNMNETLSQTSGLLENLRNMTELYINIANQDERTSGDFMVHGRKLQLAAQIAPIMDRVGRMLSDLAPHLQNVAYPDNASEEHKEATREGKVPLIANTGDVAVVTNIMDRLLFAETPSIELHVHAFLNPTNRPPERRNEPPVQANRPEEHATQTEEVEKFEVGTGTELQNKSVEIQTDIKKECLTIEGTPVKSTGITKERDYSSAKTKLVKQETVEKTKAVVIGKVKAPLKRTIIRGSPNVNKAKVSGVEIKGLRTGAGITGRKTMVVPRINK